MRLVGGAAPWVALGCALGVSAGIMLMRARGRAARTPTASNGAAANVEGLRAQLQALEQRVRSLEAGRSPERLVIDGVPPPVTAGAPARPADPGANPAPAARAEAEALDAYFVDLDSRLVAEARDVDWSDETERQLRALADGSDPVLPVDDLRCMSTLCRLTTHLRGNGARDEAALEQLVQQAGSTLPEATLRRGPQPGRVTVYLARSGTGLPPLQTETQAANAP